MEMFRHFGSSVTCIDCSYVLVKEHSPFGKRVDDKINDLADIVEGRR
jgi:hypothetical protein